MKKQVVSDLTIDQLVQLIRKTVQEAMIEVLIEFSVAAQHDADVAYQAEMTDMLRDALNQELPSHLFGTNIHLISDD